MKKKIKVIAMLAVCLAAFIAAASVMFAWMTSTLTVQKAEFKIKTIESTIEMYSGIDSNYNGVPDLLTSLSQNTKTYRYTTSESSYNWRKYEKSYYAETYAFDYHDKKYLLSSDNTANTFNTFTITDLAPSRIYTFKFSITNYSDYGGTLSFGFEDQIVTYTTTTTSSGSTTTTENKKELDDDLINLLQYFDCRLLLVDSNGTPTQKSTATTGKYWTDFVTEDSTTGKKTVNTNALASSIAIENSKASDCANKVDVWLQIRMKSDATLADFGLPSTVSYNITKAEDGYTATISGDGVGGSSITADKVETATDSSNTTTYTVTYTYGGAEYTITTTNLSGGTTAQVATVTFPSFKIAMTMDTTTANTNSSSNTNTNSSSTTNTDSSSTTNTNSSSES